ncbi:MAG: hypothetical protein Q8Q73_13480 [Stagnimonas sp.]|nr:hypothetical protein [Stagnimonas sp.]
MLKKLRLCVAVALLGFLGGCVTTGSVPDGQVLEPSQGLLAMQVTTNTPSALAYVDYSPVSTFGSRFAENMVGPKGQINFETGEAYWVVPIPEGEYMWSKFFSGGRFSNIQSSNKFRIKAGAITYIGHLHINVQPTRFQLKVSDAEEAMRSYLQSQYPAYSQAMPFEKSLTEIRW